MQALTASDIMTRQVLAAQADWSLDQLAEFFVDHSISGAPVVGAEGELVGVVSLTDLARHHGLLHAAPQDTPEYYLTILESRYAREEIAALRIQGEALAIVRDVMTPLVFAIGEQTPVQEVADTMIRGHIHRIFVTRGKQVVGIITALDMLKIIRDL